MRAGRGKAHAGDLLRQAGRRFRREAASPGARTIRPPTARWDTCWRSPSARSPACRERPGLDFRQDRADAVSCAGRLRGPSMTDKITLKTLLGDYKNAMALKKGEVSSPLVDFQFADVKVPNTAFKRHGARQGVRLRRARDRHLSAGEELRHALLSCCRPPWSAAASTTPSPTIQRTGRCGRRTSTASASALRAYSVTTATWVRGILARGLRRRPRQREMGDVRGSACGRIQGPAHRHPRRRRQGDRQDAARRRARRRGRRRQAAGSAPQAPDPRCGGRRPRLGGEERRRADQPHGGGARHAR